MRGCGGKEGSDSGTWVYDMSLCICEYGGYYLGAHYEDDQLTNVSRWSSYETGRAAGRQEWQPLWLVANEEPKNGTCMAWYYSYGSD